MRKRGPNLLAAAMLAIAAPLAAQDPEPTLSLDSLLSITVNAASRYDQTIQQAPASVSVISAEDIERYGFQTLADALSTLAGFYSSYDLNYTYVGVRGFGRPTDYNNRILLLIDGQSTNEPEYGSAPFGTDFPIPMALIERIEVVRGPGSVLFGTGAMFAVVNVVTKSAADQSSVRVSGEVGSGNRRSATVIGVHEFMDGSTLQLAFTRTAIEGWDRYFAEFDSIGVSDGVARGLDADEFGGAYLSFRRRGVSVNGAVFKREKQVPTASWDADFNNPDAWTSDERASIDVEIRRGVSPRAEVFAAARYEHYDYAGSYPTASESYRDGTISNWAHVEAGLLWDVNAQHRLVTGIEHTRVFRSDFRIYYDGEEGFDLDVPFNVTAVYGQLESKLSSRFTTILGLSQDYRSEDITFTSPRAAVLYTHNAATTVKLLFGKAFRAPAPYELYSVAGLEGVKQAADLSPEKIATAEIALEQRIGRHGALSASVYRTDVKDLINYVPLDNPNGDDGEYRNTASAHAAGVELTARLRDWRGHTGALSITYQQTEDGEAGERLTNAPKLLLNAAWHTSAGVFIAGVNAHHESDRLTLAGSTTPAFTRFDGTLTAKVGRRLRVTALVRNIFDAEYFVPAGAEHRQNILPQDGRTLLFRLDADLK